MRYQHLFGPVEIGDKVLWLFCPQNRFDYLFTLCGGGKRTHTHTTCSGESLSVLLGLCILLPHFRSVPKQMQIVYDREHWVAAIPLAWCIAGDRLRPDGMGVWASPQNCIRESPPSHISLLHPHPAVLPLWGRGIVSHPEHRKSSQCEFKNSRKRGDLADEEMKRQPNLLRFIS